MYEPCSECGGVLVWSDGVLICARPACRDATASTPEREPERPPTDNTPV